jgi:hypothetical protein
MGSISATDIAASLVFIIPSEFLKSGTVTSPPVYDGQIYKYSEALSTGMPEKGPSNVPLK